MGGVPMSAPQLSKAESPLISRKAGWRAGKAPWPKWYQPPIMPKGAMKRTSSNILVNAACQFRNISVQEFKSERRVREYVEPRFAVAYVLRRYRPDLSYPQIAKVLGKKDHTTIIHAVAQGQKLRRQNPEFAALVLHLEGIANGVFA